jgi:hypothetical protein
MFGAIIAGLMTLSIGVSLLVGMANFSLYMAQQAQQDRLRQELVASNTELCAAYDKWSAQTHQHVKGMEDYCRVP